MASGYYVYVLSSDTGVLHIGVTNDLHRGLEEHRRELVAAFSKRYRTTRLVYFEETPDIRSAIAREKHLKGWRRSKKLALLRSANPQTRDLSQDWEASTPGAHETADDKKDSPALCAFAEHPLGRSDIGSGMSFRGATERRRHLHRTSRKDTGTVCGAPHTCPPEGHRDDVAPQRQRTARGCRWECSRGYPHATLRQEKTQGDTGLGSIVLPCVNKVCCGLRYRLQPPAKQSHWFTSCQVV